MSNGATNHHCKHCGDHASYRGEGGPPASEASSDPERRVKGDEGWGLGANRGRQQDCTGERRHQPLIAHMIVRIAQPRRERPFRSLSDLPSQAEAPMELEATPYEERCDDKRDAE